MWYPILLPTPMRTLYSVLRMENSVFRFTTHKKREFHSGVCQQEKGGNEACLEARKSVCHRRLLSSAVIPKCYGSIISRIYQLMVWMRDYNKRIHDPRKRITLGRGRRPPPTVTERKSPKSKSNGGIETRRFRSREIVPPFAIWNVESRSRLDS